MTRLEGHQAEAESKKQKLTLSVDSDVVEKAKKLGLNMSDITEKVLRTFTFEPESGETKELYGQYKAMFDDIVPLLGKYNVWIKIASEYVEIGTNGEVADVSYTLGPDGGIWNQTFERSVTDLHEISVHSFESPNAILASLIKGMAESAENNKQRLKELELARRIVEAIATTSGSPQKSIGKRVIRTAKTVKEEPEANG